MGNFGITGVDWQERINWDRLRKYRLERARERMKAHGLGAMLLMYDENLRYVTSTLTPGWNRLKPGLRYGLLCGDAAPVLFEQGDIGDAAYIIIEGTADVIVTREAPMVVAQVGKDDIVGEIAILVDIPRTATVTPTSELTALKITKDLFFRMITDFPEMGVEIMRVLAQRLEQTTAQLLKARAEAGNRNP